MYRMATAMAPYASHPDLPQFHRQVEECQGELAEVGALANELRVRLSTHPGQYTVLNSESPAVRAAAIAELEVQAALLDAMGLGPEAVVVLHVGGAAGGHEAPARTGSLPASNALSEQARARLVLENDDRVFGAGRRPRRGQAGGRGRRVRRPPPRLPQPRRGIDDREALELALGTWPPGVAPKIHFSSPRLDIGEKRTRVGRRVERRPVLPDLRLHADLIDPVAFKSFLRHTAAGPRLRRDAGGQGQGPRADFACASQIGARALLDFPRWQSSRGP